MADAPAWDSLSQGPAPAPEAPPKVPEWDSLTPSWDNLKSSTEMHQTIPQKINAAVEGVARGFTAGGADVLAEKINPYLPESLQMKEGHLQANREANPVESTLGEIGGTAALLNATGGLGLAPGAADGWLSRVASNALQGALISGTNSVSNDLAFGDPSLNASKLLSHAGTSAMWGGAFGGAGTAFLEGASSLPSTIVDSLKKVGAPDLSVSTNSLSPLERIRMGLFSGLSSPEAQEGLTTKVASGLDSLNHLSSMEDLSAISDASAHPKIKAFLDAKDAFLKEFGDVKTGKVDPDEVLSFITNPASKNSTQQTIAFNHYLKSIDGLSDVKWSNENIGNALKEAQGNLNDWQSALVDSNFTSPYQDIEYGGPAHAEGSSNGPIGEPSPYNTKLDVYERDKAGNLVLNESGNPIKRAPEPNYGEGITLGSGEQTARVPSFGTEQVSPFDTPKGFNLKTIQAKIKHFHSKVSDLMEQANEGPNVLPEEISSSLGEAKGLSNQVSNLNEAKQAIANRPPPLGAGIATVAAHIPGGTKALALFSAIRNYAGDGGLYRLGHDIASPLKMADGVAKAIKKVDDRIGTKARLIFTAGSSQAQKLENK